MPLRVGTRLFERDCAGDAVYVVQAGIVKETIPGADGEEVVVRIVVRHGVAGLAALLRARHRHSAVVIHPGVACRIPVELIERLRGEQPALMHRLYADWQGAVDDADRLLGQFQHGTGRARLARAVLYLMEAAGPDAKLKLGRKDLARMIAMTPVSVARLMAVFRKQGLIEERGRICVRIDRAGVERLAYAPPKRIRASESAASC